SAAEDADTATRADGKAQGVARTGSGEGDDQPVAPDVGASDPSKPVTDDPAWVDPIGPDVGGGKDGVEPSYPGRDGGPQPPDVAAEPPPDPVQPGGDGALYVKPDPENIVDP